MTKNCQKLHIVVSGPCDNTPLWAKSAMTVANFLIVWAKSSMGLVTTLICNFFAYK